ncbi:MAG: hypothetical protein M0Z66_14445 [Thermaerobacter sp.]|nr:hypothetical protein [Thermaerobacter sp.]
MNRSTRRGRSAIVREKFDLEGATGFGGANLLVDYAQKIGLRKAIRRETRRFEKRDNAIYPLARTLELMVFGRVLGVGRLHEFEVLEKDDLLRLKLGLHKMPDTTLLYRDLERLSEDRHRDSLRRLARFAAGRVLGKEVHPGHGQHRGDRLRPAAGRSGWLQPHKAWPRELPPDPRLRWDLPRGDPR